MSELRVPHACSACRSKKIRCLPSPEVDEPCRRCKRLDLECVVPVRKQRPKKSRLRGRVDHVETALTQIMSLLAKKGVENGSQRVIRYQGIHGIPTPESVVPTSHSNGSEELLQDLETGLPAYRRMSSEFWPFVMVPDEVKPAVLLREGPLLSQAIVLATLWNLPSKQAMQKKRFLEVLSSKYFACERSLELLQSLLVYFGWCHWHISDFSSEAWRPASMIVALAMELGIGERPTEMTQHQIIMQASALSRDSSIAFRERGLSHELKRAYAGAYLVSIHCSLLFRKQCSLSYTAFLHECAMTLRVNPQYPSDTMIVHRLELMRLCDDVTKSFDHGSSEIMREISDGRICVLVKGLTRQLGEFEAQLPQDARADKLLSRSLSLARTYIHEVGLYNLLQGQTPSIARIDMLLELFNATKGYIDHICAVASREMSEWSCFDWRMLNYAILVNSKSATILDTFCYCNDQRAQWMEASYTNLCGRTMTLLRTASLKEHHLLERMAADWTTLNALYQRSVQAMSESSKAVQEPQLAADVPCCQVETMYNMSWNTFGIDWSTMPYSQL